MKQWKVGKVVVKLGPIVFLVLAIAALVAYDTFLA